MAKDTTPPPSPGPLPEPPPFDPDPLLVDHLEGNIAERDRYRSEVADMVDTAESEAPDD